ncbi:MAG: thiamine pyrophosphate-binding protein [Methylocystis sp.]|uniref:thiamine pyrophosphate-binding protein n=1 Tax=Methylocystis sp. TaxID=1911079 RepID=UPI003DA3A05A
MPDVTAAEALVDQLLINGVDHVFCVPGESYLSVLDACYGTGIKLTVCRNEAGAAMMADAYGKATGRPGICFVTRGPGAANAFAGIHIAQHDSTPMILFIGQIERRNRDRGAFQEVDYRAMFGGQTKWTAEVDDASRIVEYVSHAFQVALAGRQGPVALALPKDMLEERIPSVTRPRVNVIETAPDPAAMATLSAMLKQAQRPLFLLGGTRWDDAATRTMMDWARTARVPVATSYRRLPLFDPLHECYAGDLGLAANPKLIERIKRSDLFVVVGGRLGEIPSQGYTLFDPTQPQTRFVHIYPQAEEFGRVYAPALAIHASPKPFVEALAQLPPPSSPVWRDHTAEAHRDYLAFSTDCEPSADVDMGRTMIWLRENLPADAIICNGAGNYASWIHRYFRFRTFGSHFAPTSATMGYGVPAAVALQRLHPDRLVVSVNGDGDFLMNGQEFATAVQYALPIIVIICDNGSYGTIRMHQERTYPARVVGTDLVNPDFAAYARAFGGFGARVEKTADIPEAFAAARASGLPSILHLLIDPDRVTPTTNLSSLRAAALAGP